MSKEAREARFVANLAKENQPSADEFYAHAIHKIERETGILIDEDFLLLKFLNLLDWCDLCEEEKQRMEEDKQINRTIGGHTY